MHSTSSAVVRNLPRACMAVQTHLKPLAASSQQRPASGIVAERSSIANETTPSANAGSLRLASPVQRICSGASAFPAGGRPHNSTKDVFGSAAAFRQLCSSTAQEQSSNGNSEQPWNSSTAWALGCASIVAGLGHLLSHDSVNAEAPAAADVALEPVDATPQAVATISRLSGAAAKDAQAAVKLVASKGLLSHADFAVRKEALAALLLLIQSADAKEVAWGAGLFKSAVALVADCVKDQTSAEHAALLPFAAAVLPGLAEGKGKAAGQKEMVTLVEMLNASIPDGKSDIVEALKLLAAEPSAVPALLKAGVCKSCSALLADSSAPPETRACAAGLLANVTAFDGSWTCSPASAAPEWQRGVQSAVWLTVDPHPLSTKVAAAEALGKILGSGSSQALEADTIGAAVSALGFLLGGDGDGGLKAAALEGLRKASGSKAGVAAVGESPTIEKLMLAMGDEEEANAIAAIETMNNVAKQSGEIAERLALAGAVQGVVKGAMTHRGSLEVREAVAGVLETMVAAASEDVKMRVACYATPVVTALARTSDEGMQLRALELLRKLSLNTLNKFTMQKDFEVIQELIPLLSRPSATQQAIIMETLAHLASTDNAYYGENARVLGEARGMKPLMVLARSRDPKVHRNATWALACMTACERNHVPMRAAIDTLLQVVERGSPAAQRYAVMAVSNLAATQRTRELLTEKGAEGILRKCAQANSGDRMINDLIRTTALVNLKRGGKSVFNVPPPS